MLECVEHEAAKRGDSVQLSRQWLMTKELEEQTERAYFSSQFTVHSSQFTVHSSQFIVHNSQISLRGVGPEAVRLIERYGLIPYQNEKTEITKSSVVERKLMLLARQARSVDELRERMKDILPRFTISSHNAFYYLSMRYNPLQFAESIMYCQHWRFYASVPYHPYGEPFALEVADNYNHHEYMNVPIDTLTNMVLASLRKGHAVYWEYGKRTKDGSVSSDHAMAIVGIKGGEKGENNLKFVCKNSYGKKWGNKGYCLISIEDFKKKTCNVGILEESL